MSNGPAQPTLLGPPSVIKRYHDGDWNINRLSIAYAFRPRLRPD